MKPLSNSRLLGQAILFFTLIFYATSLKCAAAEIAFVSGFVGQEPVDILYKGVSLRPKPLLPGHITFKFTIPNATEEDFTVRTGTGAAFPLKFVGSFSASFVGVLHKPSAEQLERLPEKDQGVPLVCSIVDDIARQGSPQFRFYSTLPSAITAQIGGKALVLEPFVPSALLTGGNRPPGNEDSDGMTSGGGGLSGSLQGGIPIRIGVEDSDAYLCVVYGESTGGTSTVLISHSK